MFGKWARCMHRGRLFSEAYYITLDRHKVPAPNDAPVQIHALPSGLSFRFEASHRS